MDRDVKEDKAVGLCIIEFGLDASGSGSGAPRRDQSGLTRLLPLLLSIAEESLSGNQARNMQDVKGD
jgi:hypothetical protein